MNHLRKLTCQTWWKTFWRWGPQWCRASTNILIQTCQNLNEQSYIPACYSTRVQELQHVSNAQVPSECTVMHRVYIVSVSKKPKFLTPLMTSSRRKTSFSWKTTWYSQEKHYGQVVGKDNEGRDQYQISDLWWQRSLHHDHDTYRKHK